MIMPKVLHLTLFLLILLFPEESFSTSEDAIMFLLPIGALTDRTAVLDLRQLPGFEVERNQLAVETRQDGGSYVNSLMQKCGGRFNFKSIFIAFLLFGGANAENGHATNLCPTLNHLPIIAHIHQTAYSITSTDHLPVHQLAIGSNNSSQIRMEVVRAIYGQLQANEALNQQKIDEIFHQIAKTTGWGELEIDVRLWKAFSRSELKKLPEKETGMEKPTAIEFGRKVVEKLCGQDCFHGLRLDLPEFGAIAYSRKPVPGPNDVDRLLRPYLLQMNRKLGIGRLWVDNPAPGFKNGFMIGYELDDSIQPRHAKMLDWHFSNFQRFSPFVFVDASKREAGEFKDIFRFKLTSKSRSESTNFEKKVVPNGLDRRRRVNLIAIDEKTISTEDPMSAVLLKALCEECADGMKAEYGTKQEKYLPESLKPFVRLNVAYGAENYYIRGYNYNQMEISNDLKKIEAFGRCQGTTFWTDYPNCQTGKYEIPVFIEAKIDGIIRRRLTDIFAVFAKRTPLQFVPQVQMPQDKFFVHIHWSNEMWRFSSQIGHEYVLVPGYDGEKLSLGTGLTSMSAKIRDYVLYHELLHVVGLRHENQRADAGKHITLDFEGIDGIADPGNEAEWSNYVRNYPRYYNYLPNNKYNLDSIMHLHQHIKEMAGRPIRSEPHPLDWKIVNFFYETVPGQNKFDPSNVVKCRMPEQ